MIASYKNPGLQYSRASLTKDTVRMATIHREELYLSERAEDSLKCLISQAFLWIYLFPAVPALLCFAVNPSMSTLC